MSYVRTAEHREKMAEIKRHQSPETREKIAASKRGKPLSEAHKEAMRRNRAWKPSSLELKAQEALNEIGVEYVVHKHIRWRENDKRKQVVVDLFVPDRNLVIEVNGCWHHDCLRCFPEQWRDHIGKQQKDQARIIGIERQGFHVVEVWEHELKDNAMNALMRVLQAYEVIDKTAVY